MADEDFAAGHAYTSALEEEKRDEIAKEREDNEDDKEDENLKDAPDMPNPQTYDEALPDFGEADSCFDGPASSRAPAEQQTKVNFAGDAAEGGGGAVRSGPGKDEFHHHKPIKMKDLSTNICVWRKDKKTYVISSGVGRQGDCLSEAFDWRRHKAHLPSSIYSVQTFEGSFLRRG